MKIDQRVGCFQILMIHQVINEKRLTIVSLLMFYRKCTKQQRLTLRQEMMMNYVQVFVHGANILARH